MSNRINHHHKIMLIALVFLLNVSAALAQTTAFTYQGKLTDNNGTPLTGQYDFLFRLYDAQSNGIQLGDQLFLNNVAVDKGIFSVHLDFYPCASCPNGVCTTCFNGGPRFLDIGVRSSGSGSFILLTPRQTVTANPYAIKSLTVASSDSLSSACVLCVTDAHIQSVDGSKVTGSVGNAANAASLGGVEAARYVMQDVNGNASVPGNFGAAGTLSSQVVSAQQGYNLSGVRVLSISGIENTFVGVNAGKDTLNGANSFFGNAAGRFNNNGLQNSFFGVRAGYNNLDGMLNTFVGYEAGRGNITGDSNSFFGTFAGGSAAFGNYNTMIGYNTFGGENISHATAIGAEATVSTSNSIALGRSGGQDNVHVPGNIGIGTTAPIARLTISTSSTSAADNTATFGAPNIGVNLSHIHYGATGDWYIRSAAPSGKVVLQDLGGNVGIGTPAPATKLHISGTGIIRARVNSDSNAGLALTLSDLPKWSVATTTGGNFLIFNDATTQNAFSIDGASNVISINFLGSAGSSHLCLNGSNQISGCASSRRYKSNIATMHSGLSLIHQLRPVTFDWKQNGEHDLGLIAEEVEQVEPLLVTHNAKGEIEGVKYDRVAMVLLNAVKEQQQTIASLQNENVEMKARLATLERLLQQQRNPHHRKIGKPVRRMK